MITKLPPGRKDEQEQRKQHGLRLSPKAKKVQEKAVRLAATNLTKGLLHQVLFNGDDKVPAATRTRTRMQKNELERLSGRPEKEQL